MPGDPEQAGFAAFRDALSSAMIERLETSCTRKKKRPVKSTKSNIAPIIEVSETSDDAEILSDFVEYHAEEIFTFLPEDLRMISYTAVQDNTNLAKKYDLPLDRDVLQDILEHLPPTVSDSLATYNLTDVTTLDQFLEPVLAAYIQFSITAPPEYTSTLRASRPDGCEICGREHLPLTYHHLIPRQMHGKAVKRGWHKEWALQKVAWLCRACHSFLHRILTNEEMAREWYDVENLVRREDVQNWANWIRRIRWKAR